MTALLCVRVFVAPAGTVRDRIAGDALAWVEISAHVRLDAGIEMDRGLPGDGFGPDSGSHTILLTNDSGGWTPGRDLGGIVAGLAGLTSLDGVPIMVQHEVAPLMQQTLWTGIVTRHRIAWAAGMLPVVTLTCADPVATLQRWPMRALPVTMTVDRGAAAWCYPLGENAAPMSSATTTPRVRPLSKVAVGFPLEGNELDFQGFPSPGSNDGDPEMQVPVWVGSSTHAGWALDTGNVATADMPWLSSFSDSCTLHAMIAPSPEGLGRERYALSVAGDIGSLISIGVDALNYPTVEARPGAPGVVHTLTSPTQVRSGEWSHVALRLTGDPFDTVAELWVDGALVVSATFGALWYSAGSRRVVVGARITPRGELVDVWEGSVANASAHQGSVPDLVLQRIAAGRHGWTGDDTCGRFNRILYALGFDRPALDEGSSTMCPQHTEGLTVAEALTDCASAERSPWWVNRHGWPTMRPRSADWSAVSTATIDAAALQRQLEFVYDGSDVRTRASVQRPGGAVITRRSDAADRHGDAGPTITLLVDSDGQVEVLADEMVSDRHALPRMVTPSLAVDIVRSGQLVDKADVLQVEVGDVVTVDGLPASAPWTSRRLQVRRITDRVDTSGWQRTFAVIDAPDLFDVFRVGDELDGPRVLGW